MTDDRATPEPTLPYGQLMSRMLPAMHRGFLVVNGRLALPVLHAGLAPFWSLPFTGYMAVLRTRGRKSGVIREAPLGYVIWEDAVYVWAGFGPTTQWLRNIEADPRVEVVLPGRSFSGLAEVVTDPDERLRAGRALAASLGVIGRATLGVDPRTASDEQLSRRTQGLPLVRIRPTGIAAGPLDPGGTAWVVYQLVALWASWRALGLLARIVRRRPHRRGPVGDRG
jgi:deazaflavin-dependent oxidoreductase (nitroreductase family)